MLHKHSVEGTRAFNAVDAFSGGAQHDFSGFSSKEEMREAHCEHFILIISLKMTDVKNSERGWQNESK